MFNNINENLCTDRTYCSQVNLHHCVAATQNCCDKVAGGLGHRTDNLQTTTDNYNGHMRKTNGPFIVLVQEPYLQNEQVKVFNNIKLFCSNEKNNRACIFTHNDIEGFILHQFTDRDHTTVSIRIDNQNIIFCSAYFPFDSPDPPPSKLMVELVKYVRSQKLKLICGADSNAHNQVWGSSNDNHRGEALLDFILSNNLILLNQGTRPTFMNVLREEVLDITFVTDNLADGVHDWRVSDAESFSDHMYIDFNLNLKSSINNNTFRNPRKTDWKLYRQILQENRDKSGRVFDIELSAVKLHEDIIDAF